MEVEGGKKRNRGRVRIEVELVGGKRIGKWKETTGGGKKREKLQWKEYRGAAEEKEDQRVRSSFRSPKLFCLVVWPGQGFLY